MSSNGSNVKLCAEEPTKQPDDAQAQAQAQAQESQQPAQEDGLVESPRLAPGSKKFEMNGMSHTWKEQHDNSTHINHMHKQGAEGAFDDDDDDEEEEEEEEEEEGEDGDEDDREGEEDLKQRITDYHDSLLKDYDSLARKKMTAIKTEGFASDQQLNTSADSPAPQKWKIIDLDDYMETQQTGIHESLGQEGLEGKTILHKIISLPPQKFGRSKPLFHWVMKNHATLYAQPDGDSKTILKIAAKNKESERVVFLLTHFPEQMSALLHGDPKLIYRIMPHVRKCPAKVFPTLFKLQTATQVEEFGVIQHRGKTTCTMPLHRDGKDNTVLHYAAKFEPDNTPEEDENQLALVKVALQSNRKALSALNKDGYSPYRYRIHTAGDVATSGAADGIPLRNDPIAKFLKDEIMHLPDREEMIRMLHGDFPKREIHLDLVELQNREYELEDVEALVRMLQFENILQYVQIPRYPFARKGRMASSEDNGSDNESGVGRMDFKPIFDLLRAKNVDKIIKLIVDDDEGTPHSDEVIEELRSFNIEQWDWRKTDLCSEVINTAAPNAKQLRLCSSGNRSVLRSWSANDGLNRLKELKAVHVYIRQRLESEARTRKYADEFKERMAIHCPRIRIDELRIDKATARTVPLYPAVRDIWSRHRTSCAAGAGYETRRTDQSWYCASDKTTTNAWLDNMDRFAGFIVNLPEEIKNKPEVRIAIIDDGVEYIEPGLKERVEGGESYYTEQEQSHTRTNQYFFSSTGHGTLMAQTVLRICPQAKLYIARLDHGYSSTGAVQPTTDSATKAIRWATKNQVHIISMSWTIIESPENSQQLQELNTAIKEAHGQNILMFGAASDQGYNSSSTPYPAKSTGVICIGAAERSGHVEKLAEKDADYVFPGSTHDMALAHPLPTAGGRHQTVSGSSFATALGAGLTGLILYCVEISKYGDEYRQYIQRQNSMTDIFRAMAQAGGIPKYIGVERFFKPKFQDLDWDQKECREEFNEAVAFIIR